MAENYSDESVENKTKWDRSHETKTLSWKTLHIYTVVICGFAPMSNTFHIINSSFIYF